MSAVAVHQDDKDTAQAPNDRDVFEAMVVRLSRQSLEKHFDAYADVDWDSPDMAINPDDGRFRLWSFDPLAATDWYRSQPPEVQSRAAVHRMATAMRLGWEFENVLQRGLLEYVFWLPNGRPEFRYLHHEIIEESQHTLMFQEFVNRTGLDIRGLPLGMKVVSRGVVGLSRVFPALFFMFVIGGEDPVDHLQRRQLRSGGCHPLLERIMRIHVTEEARHLSFARQYLKRSVPRIVPAGRTVLAVAAPILLATMGRVMVYPARSTVRACGVPRADVRRARRTPEARQLLRDALAKPRRLCTELGLTRGPARLVWKAMGIWDADDTGHGAHGGPDRGTGASAEGEA
jgi:hypothetical protein